MKIMVVRFVGFSPVKAKHKSYGIEMESLIEDFVALKSDKLLDFSRYFRNLPSKVI